MTQPTTLQARAGAGMVALVRSEVLKLRTTHVWWGFGLAVLLLTLVAQAFYMVVGFEFRRVNGTFDSAAAAAELYTAGQFFGLLFAMLLGTLLMTNEYQHQTASATFLVAPDRTRVVFAKLTTAVGIGVAFWGLTTGLNLMAGTAFLASVPTDLHLTDPETLGAIGLNLLAYVLWAILGVGVGTVIRSQIAAVVITISLYVLTGTIAQGVLMVLATFTESHLPYQLGVLLPYTASELMVSGSDLPDMPPRWVGGLVLTGYGLLAGIAGAVATTRRDIS